MPSSSQRISAPRPAVVKEYEKMRDMFSGDTPPPWSRTRRKRKREGRSAVRSEEMGNADLDDWERSTTSSGCGALEIVMTTGGMGMEEEWEWCRWCHSTVARKEFLRISVRMYSRCTGT